MASCCLARPEKAALVSKDSALDKLLLEGFAKVQKRGDVLRSSIAVVRRRRLEGQLGIVVQAAEELFSRARELPPVGKEVMAEPDPDAFDFTKADEAERLATLDAAAAGGCLTAVFASCSPVCKGHVLVVPRCEERLPQHLTEDTLLCGLRFLAKSTRLDFRLVFDSLAGCERVNHFHYDGLYLNYTGLTEAKFCVENAGRSTIAGDVTAGNVCIELLQESQWYARGFVVSAGAREGVRSKPPAGDVEALAFTAARIVAELQRRNVPHTVILCPALALKESRSQSLEDAILGNAAEDAEKVLTPEVYVLPRGPEEPGAERLGCELAGLVLARTDDAYSSLTEGYLREVFSSRVSCKAPVFDEVLCQAAWLSN